MGPKYADEKERFEQIREGQARMLAEGETPPSNRNWEPDPAKPIPSARRSGTKGGWRRMSMKKVRERLGQGG